MRKVVGWKCYALSTASARNRAGIMWEGRQTWCSPAWHGATEEMSGVKKKSYRPCYPQPGVSAQPKTMATFHNDEGCFFLHRGESGGSRWNGCHSQSRDEGKESWVTEHAEKTKQSWATFRSFRSAPNEICSSEIPGHISSKHVDLKWWLRRRLRVEGWVHITSITHSLLIFTAQILKGEPACSFDSLLSPRVPPQPLCTPPPMLRSFRGRVIMKSSPLWCMFLPGSGPCGPGGWASEGLPITDGLTSCVKLGPVWLQLW